MRPGRKIFRFHGTRIKNLVPFLPLTILCITLNEVFLRWFSHHPRKYYLMRNLTSQISTLPAWQNQIKFRRSFECMYNIGCNIFLYQVIRPYYCAAVSLITLNLVWNSFPVLYHQVGYFLVVESGTSRLQDTDYSYSHFALSLFLLNWIFANVVHAVASSLYNSYESPSISIRRLW